MTDIATLVMRVDALEVKAATAETERLTHTAADAEKASRSLTTAYQALGTVLQGVASGYATLKMLDYAKEAALLDARYETLGVSMRVVGNNAGYTSAEMEAAAVGMQKTGISMVESRQQALRLVQAHIDLSESSKLARIAQDAAVIGNVNSSEAFARLVHGIQTGQTEVLRTIGLNISMERSYAEYANTLGKTSKDLSQTEKTQAVLNAVMKEGEGIAGTYEAAMGTAGKQLNSMKRYTEDLQLKIGEVFNESLTVGVMAFTSGLKGANGQISELSKNGQLKSWGNDMTELLASLADNANNLFGALKLIGVEAARAAAIQGTITVGDRVKSAVSFGFWGEQDVKAKLKAINDAADADAKAVFDSEDRFSKALAERRAAVTADDAQHRVQVAAFAEYEKQVLTTSATTTAKERNAALVAAARFMGVEYANKERPVEPENGKDRKRLQEEENKRINAQAAEEVKMREADAAANQRAIEHEFNTGKQRIENIDKQITAQKRHNEEIGKTPEQIAKIKAEYDGVTIATLEAEAVTLRYYGTDISDAGAVRLRQLEEEIKKRRELVRVEEATAPLEAAKKTAAEMEAVNKKAAAEAEQHWQNFARNVQSHLGDSLYNALNGNFKNIGDSFKQMIFRMMADAAAADLTSAVLGKTVKGGGGGFNILSDIGSKIGGMLSFAGGGSTGSGARSGGVDGMGGFPAILHPNETVIDHSAGQSSAGNSVTVVQNINIDSRSDYSTIVGAMMRAKDMAKAEIMQSLQRGGDFAGAVGRA